MSETLTSPSHQGTYNQEMADDKYELAVLTRLADNEGWSDERYTEALKKLAKKREERYAEAFRKLVEKKISAASQPPTVEATVATSQPRDGAHTHTDWTPWYLCGSVEELVRIEKRQETGRIVRQADKEGWSDDKTLAALRLRNSVHYELRGRVMQTPAISSEQRACSTAI